MHTANSPNNTNKTNYNNNYTSTTTTITKTTSPPDVLYKTKPIKKSLYDEQIQQQQPSTSTHSNNNNNILYRKEIKIKHEGDKNMRKSFDSPINSKCYQDEQHYTNKHNNGYNERPRSYESKIKFSPNSVYKSNNNDDSNNALYNNNNSFKSGLNSICENSTNYRRSLTPQYNNSRKNFDFYRDIEIKIENEDDEAARRHPTSYGESRNHHSHQHHHHHNRNSQNDDEDQSPSRHSTHKQYKIKYPSSEIERRLKDLILYTNYDLLNKKNNNKKRWSDNVAPNSHHNGSNILIHHNTSTSSSNGVRQIPIKYEFEDLNTDNDEDRDYTSRSRFDESFIKIA